MHPGIQTVPLLLDINFWFPFAFHNLIARDESQAMLI
jgi:hypothetical protein